MSPTTLATAPAWHLGNDIVDLSDPRHVGKARDDRFLQRVFSEAEQEDIRSAEDPDRALWIRWAGKEAAFKTISKSLGSPPTFNHPHFGVTVYQPLGSRAEAGTLSDPPMTRFGEVRHGDFLLPLRVELSGDKLHAVTWTPSLSSGIPQFSWGFDEIKGKDGGWKESLRPRFSTAEWACVSHQASALARLAARRSMASVLGVDEGVIEIGCGPGEPGRRIPKVFLEGAAAPVDLTLSHHGRLLAWAFLLLPGP